jgi:LL-H family phage holin
MTSTQWFQLSIVILPIILPPLISLSAVLYQRLLQHLPQQKRDLIEQVVRTAVPAVEQIANDVMSSQEKKQTAIDMATRMLNNLHIQVSEDTLSTLIEATVYAMNQTKSASAIITQPSPLADAKSS